MSTGYLTPNDIPAETICRVLFIPNDLDWIGLVTGALEDLTYPTNFTPYGVVSPETTAAVFGIMFDDFCFNRGACRVIGEIVTLAGPTNPDPVRWLSCNGSSLLRADYPDLFAAIGTTYGFTDATHFSLPDMRGRAAIATGTGTGLTPRALGDLVGEEAHVLTVSELASHSHTDSGHVHSEGNALPAVGAAIVGVPVPSAIPSVGVTGSANANLLNTGLDVAHNTMQPSIALNFYIVATE